MTLTFDIGANELASLLCSKVCHDLVSPVGAMSMSMEMMEEPGAQEEALGLVKKSVESAAARLQFCRLAFGASGSVGASIDTGDAEKVTSSYTAEERADVVWKVERMILPKNKVKLLLNLVVVALGTVPRGGTIEVRSEGDTEAPRFVLHSTGRKARVPVAFDEMCDGDMPEGGIDAQNVQPYYTMLLAHEAGMNVSVELGEEEVTITAA